MKRLVFIAGLGGAAGGGARHAFPTSDSFLQFPWLSTTAEKDIYPWSS